MYEIFAKLMKAKGCTAYQVAKETGIVQSTLSDWKNGKSVPKAEKIQKIADYFGVSAEYLMTGFEPGAILFLQALILLDSRILAVSAVLYIIFLCIYLHCYSVFYTAMQHGIQHRR